MRYHVVLVCCKRKLCSSLISEFISNEHFLLPPQEQPYFHQNHCQTITCQPPVKKELGAFGATVELLGGGAHIGVNIGTAAGVVGAAALGGTAGSV